MLLAGLRLRANALLTMGLLIRLVRLLLHGLDLMDDGRLLHWHIGILWRELKL